MNVEAVPTPTELPRRGGYWRQSQRPLTSLVFVLPLLVLYEAGVLVLGPQGIRNGADAWLRSLLDVLGLDGYFALPVLTVVLLLAWHHTTHDGWRVRGRVLLGMLVESALLGFIVLLAARAQGALAYHVLDLMQAFHDASDTGQHIAIQSTVAQPAPLPIGIKPGTLDA